MPVTKLSSGRSSAVMLRYLTRENEEGSRVRALGGNVSGRDWRSTEREFKLTRDQFGVKDGIRYHHASLSLDPKDMGSLGGVDGAPDYQKLVAFGEQWAHRNGVLDRHQVLVVAHGDKPHPHVHVCWNSVSRADGAKWHSDRAFLERARDTTDALSREHGIRNLPRRDRNTARPPDAVLRAAARGASRYSWKVDLQHRIGQAARLSISEEDFKKNLQREGVEARLRGGSYTYSFRDDAGQARVARARRLGEEYLPAALKERFEQQRRFLLQDPQAAARFAQQLRTEQGMPLSSWRQDLRRAIHNAGRRAGDLEQYKFILLRQGVEVRRSEGGLVYSVKDSDGKQHLMTERQLGPAHSQARVEIRLADNAFQKQARLEIVRALRGTRNEGELCRRLAERGVPVERNRSGQFVYHFQQPEGSIRKVTGEALASYLRTEKIEDRWARTGPAIVPTPPSLVSGSAKHLGGLVERLSAEIVRDSHPGYHQSEDPLPSERRKRRLEREQRNRDFEGSK